MSDFLARAAEAALGVRRVVQPLVASRYAPGPRQPVLEMETVVEQTATVGLAGDAKSNEAADRPRGAASNDSHNVHDQAAESHVGGEERTVRPETRLIETSTALPAKSVAERQDGAAVTTQPDEYSAKSTTEQQEAPISTPSEDRVTPNTRVSIRPAAVTVRDPVEEPQNQRTTAAVAPLSVRSMSIDAAEAQTAPAAAATAVELALSEVPRNPSVPQADRPDRPDSAAGKPTLGNEVSRTDPDSHLDQSLFRARDERNSPDNSACRSVATRHVSPSPAISDRGPRDAPAPPIIRVTIGRIEVRAVAPPIETPAPPKPKMSLDEYMRRHNGRRP